MIHGFFRSVEGSRARRPHRRARRLRLETLETRRLLATFAVVNTSDMGPGSLREAIQLANANPNDPSTGPDVIEFNIPGVPPHTIRPITPLPPINDPLIIDGYSQPGSQPNTSPVEAGTNAILTIEIDGSLAGAAADGFEIAGMGSSILRGLVINRFSGFGVRLTSSALVVGNFIGTDPTGTSAAPNGLAGVLIEGSAENRIGGGTAEDLNLLSGNAGPAVVLAASSGVSPFANAILGNLIGASRTLDPLGNQGDGVTIDTGVMTEVLGNIIRFNGGSGVSVIGIPAAANLILGNSIFANQRLGIDLAADGVTPNDPLDPDQGPNGLQNFPELTAVSSDTISTTITGVLNSVDSTNFRLEFFVSETLDSSGNGQGQFPIGVLDVTTDITGVANFVADFGIPLPRGVFITATATHLAANETSEFSAGLVQPDNHEPVAGNDAYVTNEDTPLMVAAAGGLLPNDADLDGDLLAVTGSSDPVTAGAKAAVAADGSFTYDPAAAFQSLPEGTSAADRFTYDIDDGNGGTGTATVNITVMGVNDAPVAADVAVSMFEDGPAMVFPFDADDVDTDDTPATLTYAITSAPAGGSVVNNGNGTFTFDPGSDFQDLADGQARLASFTYEATDQHLAISDSATVTITVRGINDAPQFALGADPLVAEDAGPASVPGFAGTIGAGGGETGQTLTFDVKVTGTTGSLAFDSGPAIDPVSGELTFETSGDTHGTAAVEVTLMDDGGTANGGADTSPAQTFSITVAAVNDPPVARDDSAVTLQEVPVTVAVVQNDTDADGPLEATAFIFSGSFAGTVTGNPAAGEITFTPAAGAVGTQTVTYQVVDGAGAASNPASVTIDVAPTSATLVETSPAQFELRISDVAPGGKDDHLTLRFDGGTGELVVADTANLIADLTAAPLAGNEIRVPLAGVTGGRIVVELLGGDDEFDIDLSTLPGGLDRSLTINGGDGFDTLIISGPTTLGAGALSTNPNDDDMEDIFVNAALSTLGAPVTLTATSSLEVNAAINTGAGAPGPVHLKAGLDVFGNCSQINAGSADIRVEGRTGVAAVRLLTTGAARMISSDGAVLGCNGALAVEADSLTVAAATSVGTALLQRGQVQQQHPLRTRINTLDAQADGLGIFVQNQGALNVQRAAATAPQPLGIVDIATMSPLTVDGPVIGSQVVLTAGASGADDDLTLSPRARVEATGGSVLLSAADRLIVSRQATVAAATSIEIVAASQEALEPAHGASPWQNRDQPLDVNADSIVAALDALVVINFLNTFGAGLLSALAVAPGQPAYVDTSGDSAVSPLDVLGIINHLSEAPSAEAEGESARRGGQASVARPAPALRAIIVPQARTANPSSQPPAPTATQSGGAESGSRSEPARPAARTAGAVAAPRASVVSRRAAEDELESLLTLLAADATRL